MRHLDAQGLADLKSIAERLKFARSQQKANFYRLSGASPLPPGEGRHGLRHVFDPHVGGHALSAAKRPVRAEFHLAHRVRFPGGDHSVEQQHRRAMWHQLGQRREGQRRHSQPPKFAGI